MYPMISEDTMLARTIIHTSIIHNTFPLAVWKPEVINVRQALPIMWVALSHFRGRTPTWVRQVADYGDNPLVNNPDMRAKTPRVVVFAQTNILVLKSKPLKTQKNMHFEMKVFLRWSFWPLGGGVFSAKIEFYLKI